MSEVPNLRIRVLDHPGAAAEFWEWLTRPGRHMLAADTETTGLDWWSPSFKIRLIQFGDVEGGWAIPFQEWRGLVKGALDWCSKARIPLVWHNVAYDSQALRAEGIELDWSIVEDTFAWQVVSGHADENRQLKVLATRAFGGWASAGERVLKEGMKAQGWDWATVPLDWKPYPLYGVVDTCITAALWERWADRRKAWAADHALEIATIRITGEMAWRGLPTDGAYLADQIFEHERLENEILARLKHIGITNPAQNGQLELVLKSDGYPLAEKTASGKAKLDKEVLEHIDHPAARDVLAYRKVHRWLGAYLEPIFRLSGGVLDRGFLHPGIKSMEARTSRMSVENPPLQQLPAGDPVVRRAIIPRADDEVIVSSDYGQIELRLWAAINKDQNMIDALKTSDATGGDFFVELGKTVYGDPNFVKKDPRRTLLKSTCVPLDTPILTKRGWLTHDQVRVGDETIGFNFDTSRTEWTAIRDVVVYTDPRPVVRMGTKHWTTVSTPDHRWITSGTWSPNRAPTWNTSGGITKADRLILAAPFADHTGYPITDDEAEIIGWLLSDGDLKVRTLSGRTAQGSDGRRQGVYAEIRQSKHVERIEKLLAPVEHSRRETGPGYFVWTLAATYARDLASRCGLLTADGERPAFAEVASGFSETQRARALEAMHLADGEAHLSTSDEWTRDLFRMMVFLSGRVARTYTRQPQAGGWSRKVNYAIRPNVPTLTGLRITREDAGAEPVWCVQTDLGSWTMHQDGRDVLTGNCYAKLFGGGIETAAGTAGVNVYSLVPTWKALEAAYPSLKTLGSQLIQTRQTPEGTEHVTTSPWGREFKVRDQQERRKLGNYVTQGSAAIALKKALVGLDAAGFGPHMLLPVHDEVLFSLPKDGVEDAMAEIAEVMDAVIDPEQWGIAVKAEPGAGANWAEAK